MNHLIQQLIEQIIEKKAFINNYPKPNVIFLALDSLFNDPDSRQLVSKAVISSIQDLQFDSVTSIASRGFLFSGIIAHQYKEKGEHFIQKVKSKGDPNFVQIDIETEYSSDALQVLKNTIQKDKKYLLTDDLIATGGSIMAAIKLIRDCGGQVDTVFVMTELPDEGAREKLKKEGVELISLLKFTREDLQKLLHIQQSHAATPTTPITYKLTYHEKSEQEVSAIEDQHFNIKRFADLNGMKSKNKYAKKGISFTKPTETINSKPINFYNQGVPAKAWDIDPVKLARNNFKVFSTGDAFSVMSPDIEISGANINIHVGLEHAIYSPLVLIQEALQLCRCAYEHGARSITIALPDQFHPVVHYNDFNTLLMSLFKASGANKVYFYDKNYTGKLDESHINATIPFTLSQQSDKDKYQISRRDLSDYLHFFNDSQIEDLSLDYKIMHFMRKDSFKKSWSKFNSDKTDVLESLAESNSTSAIKIPEIKAQIHVLLSCSANKPLAEKIAANLRMRGEMVKIYHIEGQGEQAKIPKDAPVCGAVVTIVQSTRPNPDHVEEVQQYQKNGASSYFFEAATIARQAKLRGADQINLINPYQFSARSDKAEDNPKGRTGAYVQQNGMLFEAAGVNHDITAECHDNHTMSGAYTGKNITGSAVSALSVISTKIATDWLENSNAMQGQLRLVTPDAGAAKRTKELTQLLQAILGKKLCESRVLGDKQRDSHQDDSAMINSLNSGNVGINANDKYLIADDETATGNTLCQAITNLKKNGAQDIAVIVVHNNMPLDWFLRQLCLARFLHIGVNDLHFSDTQEMGTMAKSYEDLIKTWAQKSALPESDVEKQAFKWFKENISDITDENVNQEFIRFKSMFSQFEARIKIHSLANELANKVATKPYMGNPYAFEYKVNEYIRKIQASEAKCIVVFEGASVAAASAAALELGLPLQVIPQSIPGMPNSKITLPITTFALIGTATELPLKTLAKNTSNEMSALLQKSSQNHDDDLAIISGIHSNLLSHGEGLSEHINSLLSEVEASYQKIKLDQKLNDLPVKLLGVGLEGQVLAGQLCHLLMKKGIRIGITTADNQQTPHINSVVYSGKSGIQTLSVDRNSCDMGDVCIAVASDFTLDTIKAIDNLSTVARISCPYYCSPVNQKQSKVITLDSENTANQGFYTRKEPSLFFKPGELKKDVQGHGNSLFQSSVC